MPDEVRQQAERERSRSAALARRLTIRLTADTYGHDLPSRARLAASALDRALGEEQA
jgi:hypothetical protein